jgi:hypothetical protein
MAERNEVKALLARAGVEINNALKRADTMSDNELADVASSIGNIRAIFDKNGSCGAASVGDLRAFFDKNGSCAGQVDIETALRNAVRR